MSGWDTAVVDGLKLERDDNTGLAALDMTSGSRGVQTDSVCSVDSGWPDLFAVSS